MSGNVKIKRNLNLRKKDALEELATRHCPSRPPRLWYVRRIQLEQKKLESNQEFQKELTELKRKVGNDLNLNRLKGKKYLDAFWLMHEFCRRWGLQGFRKGRPIIKGLSIEPAPGRKGVNLFIPDWASSDYIREFLPLLKDRLTGKKPDWGTYTSTRRECKATKKKMKARFLYLRNRRSLNSDEILNMIAVEFRRAVSTVKRAVYPLYNG
jgi:hypothetical protein